MTTPYYYYSKLPAGGDASSQTTVLFSHVDFSPQGLPVLAREVAQRKPEIVALVGRANELEIAREALPEYPAVLESESPNRADNAERVLVLSKLEIGPESKTSLGIEALPALFLSMRSVRGDKLLFGVLDLLPADSQQDFFKSKVTSRRMATLMRYAPESRIVVGNFAATPFSPIVAMYTRQVRLRSVMFGHGLFRTFDTTDPLVRLTLDNAFVSKDLRVVSFEMISGVSARRRSFVFTVNHASVAGANSATS